jgi:UPF0176 protein
VIHVATFYRFIELIDPSALCAELEARCKTLSLRGTVLVAPEGMNATLAGTRHALAELLDGLATDARFTALRPGWTTCERWPFRQLKVKVRAELLGLREPVDVAREAAVRVDAAEWNRLLDDPRFLVVDVRNRYEIEVGAFPRSLDPGTRSFSEFPAFAATLSEWGGRPVAMCCTGGIRCEKASAFLRRQGFDRVFQLDGGILRYLATVRDDNRFEGECFLFDQRVAVDRTLDVGTHRICHACRHPLSESDRRSPVYREGESCPHCDPVLTPAQRAGFAERRRQSLLVVQRSNG